MQELKMRVILLMTDQEDHVFNTGRGGRWDQKGAWSGLGAQGCLNRSGLPVVTGVNRDKNYDEISLGGFWADGGGKVGHWGRGGGGGPSWELFLDRC